MTLGATSPPRLWAVRMGDGAFRRDPHQKARFRTLRAILAPAMATMTYTPGQRVRITQQIARASGGLATTFEGVVVAYEQQKTGSWFAHSKDKKLWLDRLELRKDDGEIVFVNLDNNSRVVAL